MFLTEMSDIVDEDRVILLGATNHPELLDKAMNRRFKKIIYIGLPELPDRIELFKKKLAKKRNTLIEDDYRDLGKSSEGYSNDDIDKLITNTFSNVHYKCELAQYFIKIDEKLF
jgi:vacuolar protein-sorting-associated protein 4